MRIRTVRHRGPRRLLEEDDSREIRGDLVKRIRNMLAALIAAPDIERVGGPPGWRIHPLTGDRSGTWSPSASGNWRVAFKIDAGDIIELNLEDG